jgi:nicotinamidase-related amidase
VIHIHEAGGSSPSNPTIVMTNQLLLVVDMQNGFINAQTEHIVEPVKVLVQKWQSQMRGPVIYSRFINLDNSPWEKLMGWHRLKKEPDPALHPALPTNEAEIFKKGTYSAWSKEVQQICDGSGIREIMLCGVDTDQCVLETAIDIFEANLRPVVLADLCASSAGRRFHEAGLLILKRLVGEKQVIKRDEL